MKTSTWLYLDKDQKPTPWATSMVIQARSTTDYFTITRILTYCAVRLNDAYPTTHDMIPSPELAVLRLFRNE